MSTCRLLFQQVIIQYYENPTKRVQRNATCSHHDIAEKLLTWHKILTHPQNTLSLTKQFNEIK